jgi:hypothetical protein
MELQRVGLEQPLIPSKRKSTRLTVIRSSESGGLTTQEWMVLVGIAMFIIAILVYAIANYSKVHHPALFGWLYLLTSFLQTFGLLLMTGTNVDANLLFKRTKQPMVLLVIVWTLGIIIEAISPPNNASPVAWLGVLPWVYFFFRYPQVANLEDGYPRFTELIVIEFSVTLLYNGMFYSFIREGSGATTDAPDCTWYGSHADFNRSQAVVATYYFLGAVMVLVLAYQYASFQGKTPQQKRTSMRFNPSIQFYMCAYVYLFTRGSATMLRQFLLLELGGNNSADNPKLLPEALCFGPVHVIPTLTILCFRNSIHRKLGRHWLTQQESQWQRSRVGQRRNVNNTGQQGGDLVAVEEAITAGANLDDFVWCTAYGDEWTLLILACHNNHMDAGECIE